MFRVEEGRVQRGLLLAVAAVLVLSLASTAVAIWLMFESQKEQQIIADLVRRLPPDTTSSVADIPNELRWQFRLTPVILLNGLTTAVALIVLLRAYLTSEKSLRHVKGLASDILSGMDHGVITTDVTGVVTSINPRGQELLQIVNDCVGQPIGEVSPHSKSVEELCRDVLANRSASRDRDFVISTNGQEMKLRADGHILRDADQNELGCIVVVRDVTERLLTEERMQRMERFMGLGSLAAGLHHEIKNPLSALSLHVQLLDERIVEDNAADDVKEMLGVLKTEVTRINGVLEGFRDYASVSSLNLVPTDIVDLVEKLIRLVRPQAQLQHVSISVETAEAESMSLVFVDPARMEQILLNLIVNALEAMPDGGTMTIRIATSGEHLSLEVMDTGTGIPHSLDTKIFDPYFTTKSEGTGMGLAFCEKVVRQHNGQIDFRTTVDGTVFHVTLPLNRDS